MLKVRKPFLKLAAPFGFASGVLQNVAVKFQHFVLGQELAEMNEGFVRHKRAYFAGVAF